MALRLTKQLAIINSERIAERLAGPHTIAVTGVPRGGTSSVALVIREFGYFMGDAPIHFNHEDQRLQDARDDPAAFADVVKDYDARFPVWAFKLPAGPKMLRMMTPLLRNPIVIAVMRSPATVVRSRFARRDRDGQDLFLKQIAQRHTEWAKFMELAQATDAPLMLVQYETLMTDQAGFTDELADALELKLDDEVRARAAAAITNTGYQRFSGDPDSESPATPARDRR